MKQKHFFIGVFSFLLFSAFTTYTLVSGDYLESAPTDPSFADRITSHDDELNSLGNYFENVAENPDIVTSYNNVMDEFEYVVVAQSDFMIDNDISFEQILETPSLLPSNYSLSNAQYSNLTNVINTTMPVASPELQQSLVALREYIDLVHQLRYSILQVYDDSTGEGIFPGNTQHITGGETKGLQSQEAIRKLKDLLKNKLLNRTEEQFSIYPNPLSNSSTISFLNSISGEANFVLYDIKGRTINATVKKLENGTADIQVSEIMDIEKLPKGIYILKINTAAGHVMSNKLIIK